MKNEQGKDYKIKKFLQSFFEQIQADFRLFIYFCFLLTLFRVAFIIIMKSFLEESSFVLILEALLLGFRLSLKSAGAIMLLSFVFISLPGLYWQKYAKKTRVVWGSVCIIFLVICFFVKVPYFFAFHLAFDPLLFNIFKDDTWALVKTIVIEYPFWQVLLSIALLSFLFIFFLKKVLSLKLAFLEKISTKYAVKLWFFCLSIVFLLVFAYFVRYGGAFSYAKAISFDNTAFCNNNMLNEAVLDDIQALLRVYAAWDQQKDVQNKMGQMTKEELKEKCEILKGEQLNINDDVYQYLQYKAKGAKIKKPRQIFLIIGESYALWPLLENYAFTHIDDSMKKLLEKEHCVLLENFLAADNGTISAVNAIVTGLFEVGAYPNYEDRSYKERYKTGFAVQLKALGYKTHFWYGGFATWQSIGKFTKAQGFDRFFGRGDFEKHQGNAWGVADQYLFEEISSFLNNDSEKATENLVHVILTTSNHPPYTVDLQAAGFEREKHWNSLPKELQNEENLMKLAHFWYANKVMVDFIEKTMREFPESLFIITGDHANRFNIDASPTEFARFAIPLIIYGQEIRKEMFLKETAGQHLDILPTLVELIAPYDFVYYSLGKSLLKDGLNNKVAFNDALLVSEGKVSNWENSKDQDLKKYPEALKYVSWWLLKK